MNLIQTIYYYINMVMFVVVITLALMVALLYYFIKVKKVVAKKENIDTSKFKRKDSISYAAFKDIVSRDGSLDSEGMVVINDRTFVGGISVRGFEYPAATSNEKIDAQVYSVQFFNVVETPTSFRQSVRSADLSLNIEEHKEIAKKISYELLDIEAEYRETMEASENFTEEPEKYQAYATRLTELQRMHFAKKHMLEETQTLIEYMCKMSGDAGNRDTAVRQKTSQILFSYTYNPNEYIEELSKDEIYMKAMEELDAKAQSYGEALAACHFRSKRLTARDFIGQMRKHTCPVTGEDFDLDELLDSSYTNLFISTDSLVEACKYKITEEEYLRKVEEYQEKMKEMLERQAREREEKGKILKERAFAQAYRELASEGV